MAIDKVTPQKLNSSVDARYRPSTDMADALNITFGDDHSASEGNVTSDLGHHATTGGDLGVLKPTSGNLAVEGSVFTAQSKVIGSVTDDVLGIIFFFVWAASSDTMGVWAYDKDGVLPGSSPDSYVEVYTSSRFGFPATGFVTGDVVHIGQKDSSDAQIANPSNEFGRNVVLYFTDNINEPRKLDVYKAMSSNLSGYDKYDENDFIKACPRTPLEPITWQFSVDSSRQTSNFEKIPGMQFAYQFLYEGGIESPISTYSKLAIPKEYLQQGVNTVASLSVNVCLLTIPEKSTVANEVKNITSEVEKIRILVRFGNAGGFKVVEEIEPSESTNYLFHNDRVLYPVSEEETAMHFSGLPRKARAQAVVSNRLMYANYLEGFDNVKCDAIGTPVYQEASQNSADLNIRILPWLMQPLKATSAGAEDNFAEQKVAGYKIDTGGVPWDLVPEGSVINVQWAVNPENNFTIYDYTSSFHGNKQVGSADPFDIELPEDVNGYQVHGGLPVSGGDVLFGLNRGVGFHTDDTQPAYDSALYNEWVSYSPETGAEETIEVVHGTSAAAPLIIQGGSLDFHLRFTTNYDSGTGNQRGRNLIKKSILHFLANGAPAEDDDGNPYATILSVKSTSEYSFDVQGPNLNDAPQIWPWSYTESGKHDLVSALGGLIPPAIDPNAAPDPTDDSLYDNVKHNSPVGYIAITKADVSIGLSEMGSSMNLRYPPFEGFEHDAYLVLEVRSLENTEVRTCIPVLDPKPNPSTYPFDGQKTLYDLDISHWEVYHPGDIDGELATGYASAPGLGVDPSDGRDNWYFINHDDIDYNAYIIGGIKSNIHAYSHDTQQNRHKAVGYLKANSALSNEEPKILRNNQEVEDFNAALHTEGPDGAGLIPHILKDKFRLSLVDGESLKPINGGAAFLGEMQNHTSKMLGAFYNNSGTYQNPTFDTGFLYYDISIQKQHSWVEMLYSTSFISLGGFIDQNASFKTYANHDFGIVYYDERGRSGNANFLDSVYVGGYSNIEPLRAGKNGRVSIAMELNHEPPPWAHSYQIVYGGNSSTEDFIQYTTGPAFVNITDNESSIESDNGIIYVSLANLQGTNEVSYVDAWGAVNKDGGKALYTYSPGDKLRIISFLDADGETEVFPHKYEFEVLGVKTMTSNATDNLFHDSDVDDTVHPSKIGEFLILKNNPLAIDFSYADIYESFVNDEEFHGTTAHNKWNNRTIVEIYSPKKVQDIESRVYYETGPKYNVSMASNGNLYHQTNPLIIEDGDVYWRRVPLNTPRYESGAFIPLLQEDSKNPRFRNYFLESESFTDIFPGANSKSYGKPKIMFYEANESRNRSSVTFSERNNYSSRFNSFTRFNLSELPYKDLPNEYGAIMSLVNENDSILIIQENKVSALPVERNILSTAGGSTSLIASGKTLGTQRFYAGDYGCDTNPESVTRAGTSVYFASKKNKEVYMYAPNQGIKIVSDQGMKTFFYQLFSNAMSNVADLGVVRVVGGYDPLKDEFLLSVINNAEPTLIDPTGQTEGLTQGITVAGGDLGDVVASELVPVALYGDIDEVIYEDNSDELADIQLIQTLTDDLATANATVDSLIIALETTSDSLLTATDDLALMRAFFTDLLGDAINAPLYDLNFATYDLPNGTVVTASTYTQYVGQVANAVSLAEVAVNVLSDKIVALEVSLGLTYQYFIDTTNNFIDLALSFTEILEAVDMLAEVTQLTDMTTILSGLIPETSTSVFTLSDGTTQTAVTTQDPVSEWMSSISVQSSAINSILLSPVGGGAGLAQQIATAVSNLDETKTNLASQLRSLLESITTLTGADGITVILPPSALPSQLQAFLEGSGLDGLDTDGDQVLQADEVLAASEISTKLQEPLTAYLNGLTVLNTNLSVFIDNLLAVMNEEDYDFQGGVDIDAGNAQDFMTFGIGPYITHLEGKVDSLEEQLSHEETNADTFESNLNQLRADLVVSWNAAVSNGLLTTNTFPDAELLPVAASSYSDNIIPNLSSAGQIANTAKFNLTARVDNHIARLTELHTILKTAGYAPYVDATAIEYQIEPLTQSANRFDPLITAVEDGLTNLKEFQILFADTNLQTQYGQTGYYYDYPGSGNEEQMGLRTVSADDIKNNVEAALNGVQNALSTIQGNLVSSGAAPEDAPPQYIPSGILSLFSGDGTITTTDAQNLQQYILANGVTMSELQQVRTSFIRSGPDETTFKQLFADLTGDSAVNTADLLEFLGAFGSSFSNTISTYTYQTDENGNVIEDADGIATVIIQPPE